MCKKFVIGETKYIEVEVKSRDNTEFTITSAAWVLEFMGDEVEKGSAEIDGHLLSVLLTAPNKAGDYVLTIWYNVPPETLAVEVDINVR